MQALIMTAYRDPRGLSRRLRALSRFVPCFVHADAKGEISQEDIRALNGLSGVYAIRKHKVNWGSICHLYAMLDLMRESLKDERNTHLHLISAQDFPTIAHDTFCKSFEGNDRLHMQLLKTADYPELSHRYEHFHFMHIVNYRDKSERTENLIGRIDRFQDNLHIKRRLSVPNKGLVWCSIPREAAEYALNEPANKRLLRKLRFTYIPEEFFFQNAFAGTAWEEKITGDALRFSIWDEPGRGTPALLNEKDLPAIDESGCVFCRKVDTDSALYEILEERWLASDPGE